jgi:hypothetical protein
MGWRALAAKGSLLLGKIMSARKRTVILGLTPRGEKLKELILQGYLPGHEFIGFVPAPRSSIADEKKSGVICEFTALPRMLKEKEVHVVIIAMNEDAYQTALKLLAAGDGLPISVKIIVGEPKPGLITLVDLNYNQ